MTGVEAQSRAGDLHRWRRAAARKLVDRADRGVPPAPRSVPRGAAGHVPRSQPAPRGSSSPAAGGDRARHVAGLRRAPGCRTTPPGADSARRTRSDSISDADRFGRGCLYPRWRSSAGTRPWIRTASTGGSRSIASRKRRPRPRRCGAFGLHNARGLVEDLGSRGEAALDRRVRSPSPAQPAGRDVCSDQHARELWGLGDRRSASPRGLDLILPPSTW